MSRHPTLARSLLSRVAAGLLACAALAASAPGHADANALTDDKSVSVPTGWTTYTNATEAQLNEQASLNNARLTDIEIYDAAQNRFSATMVTNGGSYAVPGWGWYFNKTAAQVQALLDSSHSRLIDLEPYSTANGIRFAFVMVSNTGSAQRSWSWHPELTQAQVSAYLGNNNQRPIQLRAYTVGGVTKFAFIGVADAGADDKDSLAQYGLTSAQVGTALQGFTGRLLSLERRANGTYDVVMVKNSGGDAHYWRWYVGLSSLTAANDIALQFGSRVFDVETYVVNGQRRYDALMIDNANSETRRLRTAYGEGLVASSGLPNGQWGAYLRPIGGNASITLNHERRFEPASAIKAVHNLRALQAVRAGADALTSPFSYFNYPSDTAIQSNGTVKGFTNNACPNPADEVASNRLAGTLDFGKDQMMSASDNRTTRGMVLRYGLASIEGAGIGAGMMSTFIDQPLIGCPYRNNLRNLTTLEDLGRLYEAVSNGSALGTGAQRDEFFQPMNGQTFNGANQAEQDVQAMVAEEGAKLGKTAAAINDYIALMRWQFKPGGYSIGCDNAFTPCSQGFISISTRAGRLQLPLRQGNGTLATRNYVFGDYVADRNVCTPGLASGAFGSCADCPSCQTTTQQASVQRQMRKELFRTAVRDTLATY